VTYQHILYESQREIATITLTGRPHECVDPDHGARRTHAMEAAPRMQCAGHCAHRLGTRFLRRRDMDALKGLRQRHQARRERAAVRYEPQPDWQTRYAFIHRFPNLSSVC